MFDGKKSPPPIRNPPHTSDNGGQTVWDRSHIGGGYSFSIPQKNIFSTMLYGDPGGQELMGWYALVVHATSFLCLSSTATLLHDQRQISSHYHGSQARGTRFTDAFFTAGCWESSTHV